MNDVCQHRFDYYYSGWEEEMAEYTARDEAPQKEIWTSYFRHIIVKFDQLIRTQAEDEKSIIIEWIVDEWENEDDGYNIPLRHTLEPFTSTVKTKFTLNYC